MFYSAAELFKLAKWAYSRIDNCAPDKDPRQKDALVAILFSAIALEAFMNEVIELAVMLRRDGGEGPVTNFASIMSEIKSTGSLNLSILYRMEQMSERKSGDRRPQRKLKAYCKRGHPRTPENLYRGSAKARSRKEAGAV
jgi:hypothetical protein